MIVVCMATAATLLAGSSLNAALITYTDFASWNSNVSGVTAEVILDPMPPSTFQSFGSGDQSVDFGNATFSQTGSLGDAQFFVIGSGFSGVPAFVSSQQKTVGVANIQIDFAYAVKGFALNFGTENATNVSFELFNTGISVDSFTQASTSGGIFSTADFIGATSDAEFTTVLITTTDSLLNVNDVYDATSFGAVVPEPSTFAMFSLGGIGLAFSAYRRRKLLND